MNKTQDKFSLPAVTLSIFAAAAAERLPVCSSSRALLWQEVLAAVLLMILSALVSRFWQSGPPKPAAWAAAFCLQVWLAVELAGTFWKALQVCREEFSSLALLGFLPLLLWAGWQMPARAWGAPAQVLWWFVAVGSAVCLLGLSRQMHWAGLFAQAAPQSTAFTVPVYAEYFAVPLLCGREERRGVCLPILTALVQTAATLGMALVFGRTYPARELLRAWSTGTFSRLDAALLLIWLTCAIFRIGVLCTAVRMLGQEYAISVTLARLWLLLLEHQRERPVSPLPAPVLRQERIQTMLTYLYDHYSEDIALSDLAEAAHVSVGECCRSFRVCLKTTPYRFLKEYRIRKGMELLQAGHTVSETAGLCGFNQVSNFIHAFKSVAGCTPLQFVKHRP